MYHLYTNTVLGGFVRLSVRPLYKPLFPLSNFKTKHIFGILITLRKFLKLWGAAANSIYFPSTTAEGGSKWVPKAPLTRRAREIPSKAGTSRVSI